MKLFALLISFHGFFELLKLLLKLTIIKFKVQTIMYVTMISFLKPN